MTPEQSVDAMLAAFTKKQGETPNPAEAALTTGEKPAVETPAAETKTEETKPGETDGAAAQQDDDYSFDEDGFTGARDLATKLEGVQLADDLRGEIMANARIAEALAPYREIFSSPEEAKIVARAAQDFAGVQQIFSSIQGENVAQGTSSLLNKMLEMSALRDEEGNPRKRQDGSFITDGTTTNFLNELYSRKFQVAFVKKIEDAIAADKAQNGGESALEAAFDLVMESAGLRSSTADKGQDDPVLAARKAELDRQQAEINQQRQSARDERVRQHTEALNAQLQSTTDGAIESVLKHATGLNDLNRNSVVNELTKAIKAAIRANPAYMMEKDQLELREVGPARLNAEVTLAKKFLRDNLVRIAKPVLAKAGITISKKQAEKAAAQAAREQAARGDVSGSAPAAAAKQATNPRQAWSDTRERLKAQLGREPTDSEINIEMMLNLPALKGRAA